MQGPQTLNPGDCIKVFDTKQAMKGDIHFRLILDRLKNLCMIIF